MDIDSLARFLKIANKNMYASETAKKTPSQIPESRDYEYSEGDFLCHDTYFGETNFISENIVYKKGKPSWGVNYYGYNLVQDITEAELDKVLRGALKQDYNDVIPVRGPKIYKIENLEYQNNVEGDLTRFEGKEKIFRDGKQIYYAVYHGGLIK